MASKVHFRLELAEERLTESKEFARERGLDQIDLSIIIVNWNSANYVRQCLASIYSNVQRPCFEIIVVDNASFDGCEELVRTEFPAVRFLQSQENVGFARANNLAFQYSSGRNILFLNPDTEVLGSAIERMWACLESTADAGLVGARLLNSDLSEQASCVQAFPSILNQLLDAEYLRRIFPKASLWGTKALYGSNNGPVAVDVVSGACLMIRRILFEKVGLFSTQYFMYAEDVDLCYKVKQTGWKNYYAGDATVIHHGGRSTKSKPENNFAAIMMREAILKFIRAKRGRSYAVAYQVATALAALHRLALLGLIYILTLGRFRPRSLRLTFKKWSGILRWAIGLESWIKESTS